MPDRPEDMSEEELERRLRKLIGETTNEPEEVESQVQSLMDETDPDEIENRFRAIQEKLSESAEGAEAKGLDAEFEKRLKDLEVRADKAKAARNRADRGGPGGYGDSGSYKGLGVGISAAYALVGSMITGWFIGWLLDRKTGGDTYQAYCALGGCILGIVLTFVLINRSNR